jgi:hypothetical protein
MRPSILPYRLGGGGGAEETSAVGGSPIACMGLDEDEDEVLYLI